MEAHTQRFIALAEQVGALRFGRFTLKSGRVSPYFFNAGAFASGRSIAEVAACYADAITASGVDFDMLFGPAYKGIPLVSTVATALWQQYRRDVPVAYNRKEAKDHGEGGALVGAPLAGRVLVIDDVLSAGTAFGQARALVERSGARVVALAVGLDRQERGQGAEGAAERLRAEGVEVVAVATLDQLIESMDRDRAKSGLRTAMLEYRRQYGTGASATS